MPLLANSRLRLTVSHQANFRERILPHVLKPSLAVVSSLQYALVSYGSVSAETGRSVRTNRKMA